MNNMKTSPKCKIEEPEIPMELPRFELRPEFMFRPPFYNQQHHFGPNLSLNNSSPPYKKRRNASLRLKNQPSDQKMKKIDEKRGRYKRSTNNSHKKYTGVARRLLLKYLKEPQISRFQTVYESLKNSRTYYFIILAHVKYLLAPRYIQEIQDNFKMVMTNKMDFYRKEISKTNNRNFINFRLGEIAEIEFALKAFQLYFDDYVEEAVEVIYKKDKTIIIKKSQYEQTIQIIHQLEANLKQRMGDPSNRYSKKHHQSNNQRRTLGNGEVSVKKQEQYDQHDEVLEKSGEEDSNARQERRLEDYQNENKVYPLLELQNSYPYFECFFPIVFSYDRNVFPPQPPSLGPIYSQMQFNALEQEEKEKEKKPSGEAKVGFTKFQRFQEEPYRVSSSSYRPQI